MNDQESSTIPWGSQLRLLMIIEKLPLKLSGLVRNVGMTPDQRESTTKQWVICGCVWKYGMLAPNGNFSKETYGGWMEHRNIFIQTHLWSQLVGIGLHWCPQLTVKNHGIIMLWKVLLFQLRRVNNTPIVTCLVDFDFSYQLLTAHGYEDKEKSMRYVSFGDFHSHLAWGSGGLRDAPYDLELGFCWDSPKSWQRCIMTFMMYPSPHFRTNPVELETGAAFRD